jgi:hypothetical protein
MNTRTQTLLYEHLRRTELVDLEIHEVSTGASLSTETSPTTESIVPLNPEINPEKYDHPCQVENINLGGQVQPTDVYDQFATVSWGRAQAGCLGRQSAGPRTCPKEHCYI